MNYPFANRVGQVSTETSHKTARKTLSPYYTTEIYKSIRFTVNLNRIATRDCNEGGF